jgi:hypothetical protein
MMDPSEIEALAGLRPLFDLVFRHLIEGAVHGRVDVYFAAVPHRRIRPFDPDYSPARHPVGAAAISDVQARWARGEFSPVWVYPKENEFILSDDYVVWEALKKGEPEFVPCWILGKPDTSIVKDLQGPLEELAVKRALGFSTEVSSAAPPSADSERRIGEAARDITTLRREWKTGRIAIGIDRGFARQFYTDIAASEIEKRTGERDGFARSLVFGAFLLAPAALLGTCILTVIAFKWYSAIAIPIAVAIYAAYQGSSALARSKLTTISWMLALSIAAFILAGPRDPLPSALIFTFLLSLWALRFTYIAAVRSLRAFVLRNAWAYNWLRGEVRVEPTKR